LADSQDEVVAHLSRPETFDISGEVTKIETHVSIVFLAGERAYKLKKAVKFPYLDYSTVEKRKDYCAREVALNRRTAPELYLGIAPVEIGGETKDWVVVMRRFDGDGLFDKLDITPALARDLADSIAAFHSSAQVTPEFGGAEALARVINGNKRDQLAAGLDAEKVDALHRQSRAALDGVAAMLDARRGQDRVRRVHGDLHLRNICLWQGKPTLFDGIEFDDSLVCIDVLYDLAFLLMDLEHRGRRDIANIVFNRYLNWRDETQGLAALPLMMACRAGIRAHTNKDVSYLDLALALLEPEAPILIAVGGLSGSGKTRLAHALAPGLGIAPGAVVLRSDVIRKRLLGRAPEERLPSEAYANDVARDTVYAAVRRMAAQCLASGYAAVADSVHARPEERDAIAALARETGKDFHGFWLDAAPEVLASRVRERENDASDATVEVVRAQLGYDLGRIDWSRIDAAQRPEAVAAEARKILSGRNSRQRPGGKG
jgi:aminoglycoside phosphotransferase family enzyme/predicted kinase